MEKNVVAEFGRGRNGLLDTAHDMYLNARDLAEADQQRFGKCRKFRSDAEILTVMLPLIGGQLDDFHFVVCC